MDNYIKVTGPLTEEEILYIKISGKTLLLEHEDDLLRYKLLDLSTRTLAFNFEEGHLLLSGIGYDHEIRYYFSTDSKLFPTIHRFPICVIRTGREKRFIFRLNDNHKFNYMYKVPYEVLDHYYPEVSWKIS